MSRTFRRKNIEKTLRYLRRGFKTNGYYTTYDSNDKGYKRYSVRQEYEDDGVTIIQCRTEWRWRRGVPTFRTMTEEERKQQFLWLHGESKSNNAWTPSRWYRQQREARLRTHNKQELIKYMKDPENYEPMVRENPISCLWDWS